MDFVNWVAIDKQLSLEMVGNVRSKKYIRKMLHCYSIVTVVLKIVEIATYQ